MSDVTVYGMHVSNFVRVVRMVLEEKGVAYALEPLKPNSSDILALNPFGKIPVFRHGDTVIFETQAICRYIDDAFGGPVLRPGTVAERAMVDQWTSLAGTQADTAIIRGYVLAYAIPMWQGQSPDPAKVAATVPAMQRMVRLLDGRMRGRDWLALDTMTLADLMLAPTVFLLSLYPEGKAALADAPDLSRWLAAMMARDSFQRTKPPKG